jgi:IclR family transcriptional regulator, acetate operon repressor
MARHQRASKSSPEKGSEPLRRVVSILELVALSSHGLTASSIAEQLVFPLPTVFRVLRRLTALGLLDGSGRNDRYRVGPRLSRMAGLISHGQSIEEIAGPILQRIADKLGVATYLAGLFDLEASPLLVQLPQGARAPFVHPRPCASIGCQPASPRTPDHP